ncbi:MAG: gliding motility-associated C-terminal domain-containing protein [Gemmatimonadota bacterium]|nr:gliding motility-associated C-terminal domain-containing protein [Gemmatimonadota bacterium]
MRIGICVAALVLGGWVNAAAELRLFAIPGNTTWIDAKQGPLSENRFIEVIDLESYENGIGPITPSRVVPVPEVPLALTAAEVDAATDSSLFAFSLNVTRADVVASTDIELEDGTTVKAGTVLVPRWNSFPRSLEAVQLLRRAGITEIEAMINVAESFPRPPSGDKYNKGLNLTPLGIFERALTDQRLQEGLWYVFDGDPLTHFERIDRVGQDVKQQWILYIDLGRYFPIRLFRLYPSLEEPSRVSAYTFSRGLPGTEKVIAGLSLDDPSVGQLAFPRFTKIASTFPTFVPEASAPVNLEDTIAVAFKPQAYMRYARFDFQTPLDYDLAEMEFLADGFVPEAVYTSNALPLPPATLGRIFWDERKIGDPNGSRAIVRVQTGVNPEPDVLFRVNKFERSVEWKEEGASITDQRLGSKTFGQEVDLNDEAFNLEAREIFSAALPEDRARVRLTRAEYKSLPGNERRHVEPDLEFWSGVQLANNGQLINAPSGRPFIQIEVEFLSEDPAAATIISNLRFEYSAPQITDQVFGEIAPAVDVIAGRDTSFVLVLNAGLGAENNGFNRLQVFTPARAEAIEGVEVDLGDGEFLNLERVDDGGEIGEGQFRELYVADDQFVVGFPTIGPAEEDQVRNALVKVRFQGRVIDFRTNFAANVFLDTLGAETERRFTSSGILALGGNESALDTLAIFLPQRVEDNDVVDFAATDQLSDRNSLAVIADISAQSENLVTNFKVVPNPFTPNGDDVNDEVVVTFDVQRLLTPKPVYLEIFDLNGRRRRLIERQLSSGGYSQQWDGRNDAGQVVPPGLYLLRISTDADHAGEAQTRIISVAY